MDVLQKEQSHIQKIRAAFRSAKGSESFALEPYAELRASTGTGIQGKTLVSNLHFWTQSWYMTESGNQS